MNKYIDTDHLKVEIEKHIKEVKDAAKRFTPNMGFFDAKLSGIYDVMAIIDSLQQEQLPGIDEHGVPGKDFIPVEWVDACERYGKWKIVQQEQPKFNVGDLVVSKKNPHLTYKILATNIPNELGKTDYKVEIFTDGKPGLLSEPHNIHLISSDKIEDWGELVQQEQSKPSGYDKALLEVKRMVDKLYDEASIGLNEYDSGLYNRIAETCMKLREFIKARLDSDGQPEVDLEKEIDNYLSCSEDIEECADNEHYYVTKSALLSMARYFFIHGRLNARKEE